MALEVAERGRARAFVELLAQRQSANPNNQLTVKPPTIEEIKLIAKTQNATLVQYSIVYDPFKNQGKIEWRQSSLYIWVVKPTGEVAFKQVDLKSLKTPLAKLVTNSRKTLGIRGRGIVVEGLTDPAVPDKNSANQLQQLHQILIQPIAQFLPTEPNSRVIFIPQNELFLVPFAALQDELGKYLIEKHTILTAPAIQVLELTHQQRQRVEAIHKSPLQGKDILVMGNPTMPSIPDATGKLEQLPSLPGAETEAKAIAKLLNTQAIIGKDATKANILKQLKTARIAHLATHGLLDDFKLSGVPGAIALAPSGNDNGLLTASEIFDLKLNAELVVLSACDTGRGDIKGDGVIGLSRSLISAGVSSIIVSLWSVPDAPTASLMTEFYRQIPQNPDKATALRRAMLMTMKQYPNPKDWAAFTLIGEAE
jgi:CHAT domain-containing protein